MLFRAASEVPWLNSAPGLTSGRSAAATGATSTGLAWIGAGLPAFSGALTSGNARKSISLLPLGRPKSPVNTMPSYPSCLATRATWATLAVAGSPRNERASARFSASRGSAYPVAGASAAAAGSSICRATASSWINRGPFISSEIASLNRCRLNCTRFAAALGRPAPLGNWPASSFKMLRTGPSYAVTRLNTATASAASFRAAWLPSTLMALPAASR